MIFWENSLKYDLSSRMSFLVGWNSGKNLALPLSGNYVDILVLGHVNKNTNLDFSEMIFIKNGGEWNNL